mmetsp:Transcript_34984/g.56615  ORF Transcript_34984/g.56615 Transcript_34984/m.56615 type:complete len:214 (-) Transcript_34984:24-665(-)
MDIADASSRSHRFCTAVFPWTLLTTGGENFVPSARKRRALLVLYLDSMVRQEVSLCREMSTPSTTPSCPIKSAIMQSLAPGAQHRSSTRSPDVQLRAITAAPELASMPYILPSRYRTEEAIPHSPSICRKFGSHGTGIALLEPRSAMTSSADSSEPGFTLTYLGIGDTVSYISGSMSFATRNCRKVEFSLDLVSVCIGLALRVHQASEPDQSC